MAVLIAALQVPIALGVTSSLLVVHDVVGKANPDPSALFAEKLALLLPATTTPSQTSKTQISLLPLPHPRPPSIAYRFFPTNPLHPPHLGASKQGKNKDKDIPITTKSYP